MNKYSKRIRKSFNKRCKKTTNDPNFDLFGEVIVTLFDVYIWVAVITKGRFLGNLKRYNHYVENWNVANKVQRAKINGVFAHIVQEYYLYWHQREWQPDFLEAV